MAKFYTPTKLSENIRETPEGFLLCLGVPIARTGWQTYADGETPLEVGEDGTIEIYRDPEDVFSPVTMASFEGKSVTIKHPEDFVDPKNWKDLSKGILCNVRRGAELDDDGEESLLSDVLVTDEFAINLVKKGLREVSCGYEAEYEQTGKGKGKQTKIVGNHLALVEEGRAGTTYAINDHKGKVNMFEKLMEQIKAIGKTADAVAASEKAKTSKVKKTKDDFDKKDDKAKDADGDKKEEKATDAEMYDELVKAVKDLGEKVAGMSKSKDEDKSDEKSEDEDDKEEKSEDGDDEDSGMEERIKALEAAVSKLLESKDEDSESDLSGDEDMPKKDDKAKDAASPRKTGLEKTKDAKAFDQFDSKVEVMTPEKMNELNAALWARK